MDTSAPWKQRIKGLLEKRDKREHTAFVPILDAYHNLLKSPQLALADVELPTSIDSSKYGTTEELLFIYRKLSETQHTLRNVEAERTRLQTELETTKKQSPDTKEYDNELFHTYRKLGVAQDAAAASNKALKASQENVANLNSQLFQLKHNVEELKTQIKIKDDASFLLTSQLAVLRRDMDNMHRSLLRREEEAKLLIVKASTLTQEKDAAERAKLKVEAELLQMKTTLRLRDTAIAELQKANADLTKKASRFSGISMSTSSLNLLSEPTTPLTSSGPPRPSSGSGKTSPASIKGPNSLPSSSASVPQTVSPTSSMSNIPNLMSSLDSSTSSIEDGSPSSNGSASAMASAFPAAMGSTSDLPRLTEPALDDHEAPASQRLTPQLDAHKRLSSAPIFTFSTTVAPTDPPRMISSPSKSDLTASTTLETSAPPSTIGPLGALAASSSSSSLASSSSPSMEFNATAEARLLEIQRILDRDYVSVGSWAAAIPKVNHQLPKEVAIRISSANPKLQLFSAIFDPSGQNIVTGGESHLVRYDSATGKVRKEIKDSPKNITWLSFDEKGERLLASATDHTARIWYPGIATSCTINQDSDLYMAEWCSADRIATISRNRKLSIYDIQSASSHQFVQALNISSLAYAMCINTVTHIAYTGHMDRKVRMWDTKRGQAVGQFDTQHADSITAIQVSLDGSRLYTTSRDHTIRCFDTSNYKLVSTFQSPKLTIESNWCRAALSSTSDHIAIGSKNGSVFIWDTCSGKLASTLNAGKTPILGIAWDPATYNNFLCYDEQGVVTVWK